MPFLTLPPLPRERTLRQGRFQAFPIEEIEDAGHPWTVLEHVERNALRANLGRARRDLPPFPLRAARFFQQALAAGR